MVNNVWKSVGLLALLLPGAVLAQECTCEPSFTQYLTLANIAFYGGLFGVLGFLGWLLYLIKIPTAVYEVVGYSLGVINTLFAYYIPTGIDPIYTAFVGNVCIAVMLIVSSYLHGWKRDEVRYFSTLTLLFGVTAVIYGSEMLGFMGVISLLALLGFSIIVVPLCVGIGFKDNDSLARASTAAFMLIALFTLVKASGVAVPYMSLFEYGVYLVGSLTLFVGTLITALSGYSNKDGGASYVLRQIPMIVCGIAGLIIGYKYGIEPLAKMSGTFLGLYVVTKVTDIPTHDTVAFAIKGLVIALVVAVMGYFLVVNRDTFAPFFFAL